MLIALLVRLPLLTQSLWYDEVWRTRVVLSGESAFKAIFRDVHGPLYNAVMYAWIRLAGDSELIIRLPSLLASVALIGLVFHWCRRRLNPHVAWTATAWLAVCPVLTWWSTQAKNTAFTLFFTTWALMALEALVRDRSTRHVLIAAGTGLLAVLTDFQALLAFAPAWGVAGVLLYRSNRNAPRLARLGPLLVMLALIFLGSLPWLIYKANHVSVLGRDYLMYFGLLRFIQLLTTHMPTGDALVPFEPWRWWLAGLIAPFLAVTLRAGLIAARARKNAWLLAAALFGPMILLWMLTELIILWGSPQRIYQPRNLIVILPWFAILLACGAHALPRARVWIGGWISLAAVSSVLMVTLHRNTTTVMVPNPEWREFANFALGQSLHDERVGVVSPAPLLPMRYYASAFEQQRIPLGVDPFAETRRLIREKNWSWAWVVRVDHWRPVAELDNPDHREGEPHQWRGLRAWRIDRGRD